MSNINDKFGENCFGGRMRIQTEVVNGVCPTCHCSGVLVSLFKKHYRCITCGSDLEQKVNGVGTLNGNTLKSIKGDILTFLGKARAIAGRR